MVRRRQAGPRHRLRRFRPLQTETEGLLRNVFERDVVGNNSIVIDVLVQFMARLRFRVEQKVIFEAQNVNARRSENASLRIEEERVNAVARLHLLHMIRGHGMQQARAVFAGHANSPAARKIEQSRSVCQCIVSGRHI